MFVFNYYLSTILSAFSVTFVTIIIVYFKWSYQYWKRKNLPYLEPTIPFGTTTNPFLGRINRGVAMKRNYDKMKANGWKHGGLYALSTPRYLVLDLNYVRNIMTKDFQYFTDRGLYYNERDDPLSGHLFFLGGQKWKNLRTKLTPTFTSGKMKMMFQTLVDCTSDLIQKVKESCTKTVPIDIKECLGCFTTDVIGSCAFGLECNSFKEDNSLFKVYGKKSFHAGRLRILKGLLAINFPEVARFFSVALTSRDISDFFIGVVKDAVQYREKNNVARKDFLQLLIDLKNNKVGEEDGYKNDGKSLTIEEIAAQCFVFFTAGFETSSTTMTFALYELGKNQDLQRRVRREIIAVLEKYEERITYEAIQEMKYLDQVISETLRKYPPVPFVMRQCVKDYKVPGENLIIEKGMRVIIPILGIHHDEEYYPDPEEFNPERFTEENKSSRHSYAYIPFGEGPRICIGMRFALMQSKVGIVSLLKKFNFTVNARTGEPLKMKATSFVLAAKSEVWLDAKKLKC